MQIYQTKKEKILKVIQIVYDIISALFIVFVSVALAIGSNKGDKGSSEHLTPTIHQVRRNLRYDNTYYKAFKSSSELQYLTYSDVSEYLYVGNNYTQGVYRYSVDGYFYINNRHYELTSDDVIYVRFEVYAVSGVGSVMGITSIELYKGGQFQFYLYNPYDSTSNYDNNRPVIHYNEIISGGFVETPSDFLTERYSYSFIDLITDELFIDNGYSVDFTFNEGINYNAFAQTTTSNINSLILRYKASFIGFGDTNVMRQTIDYKVGWFESDSYIFDTIRVDCDRATPDLKFFDGSNNVVQSHLIDNVNPYKYVSNIYYYNSITGLKIEVATRPIATYNGETYISYNMVWSTSNLRYLRFFSPLDDFSYNLLKMANNNLAISEDFVVDNKNVGLSNAFTLIGSAFSSIIPILSISILPGISIGLLLFMPLIVGVIIFIIWVVKR